MRLALIIAIVAVTASTTAFAQSTLSGDQIKQALVGHTVSGLENGEPYSEYLDPNGTIAGKSPSGAYSGSWRIDDDEICFRYEDDTKGSQGEDCSEVKLRGNQIIWDDNTTATLSGSGALTMPPRGVAPRRYRTAGAAPSPYEPTDGSATPYVVLQPGPCTIKPRGLFGGFCNCACH